MNHINHIAVASTMQPAQQDSTAPYGQAMTVSQHREIRSINEWLEMQDDAEVSFLVGEMANRGMRAGRMSAYD